MGTPSGAPGNEAKSSGVNAGVGRNRLLSLLAVSALAGLASWCSAERAGHERDQLAACVERVADDSTKAVTTSSAECVATAGTFTARLKACLGKK